MRREENPDVYIWYVIYVWDLRTTLSKYLRLKDSSSVDKWNPHFPMPVGFLIVWFPCLLTQPSLNFHGPYPAYTELGSRCENMPSLPPRSRDKHWSTPFQKLGFSMEYR
jgi:hypothetical protein